MRTSATSGTGHAEVVEVTSTKTRSRTRPLLATFWAEHDPTRLNRQGPDVGDQYRSVISCVHDEAQRAAAEASRERVQGRHISRPVVTQIEEAPPFWEAEDYHQQYLSRSAASRAAPRGSPPVLLG